MACIPGSCQLYFTSGFDRFVAVNRPTISLTSNCYVKCGVSENAQSSHLYIFESFIKIEVGKNAKSHSEIKTKMSFRNCF
jgi:hypothetical protein